MVKIEHELYYELKDFDLLKEKETNSLFLMIDNNRDGIVNLANYNKSFLSRKLNASGACNVFLLKKGFDTFRNRLQRTFIFVSQYEIDRAKETLTLEKIN